jgi:hypothetical protein
VTNANGIFAAVTSQGRLLTSADGLTWSSQTISSGTLLLSIAYGNGTWVAVGAGGAILVSTDLKTWLNAKSATTNQLNGVLYSGVWVAVGNSATVITSPDALNWTVQTVPAGVTGFLHGITPQSTVFTPGVSAFLISGALAGNAAGAINTGVILTMSATPVSGTQNYSISGGQALNGTSATVGNLEAILSANDQSYVAVGWPSSTGGAIVYAQTYPVPSIQLSNAVPNALYRGLAYGNGYYVAAGAQGTILTSTDAINWTQRFSGSSPSTLSTSNLLGAAYSSTLQRFVITGTGGTILVSNSTPTVFGNVSTRGFVSSTQTFIGGFVIQGTGPRNVLIRGDGPVLATFGVTSPLPDPVVTVYNSSGAVVATNTGWTTNSNPTTVSTAALEVGAFSLPNPGADSALVLTLQPGSYTVQITSAKGNSGISLFEAYTM